MDIGQGILVSRNQNAQTAGAIVNAENGVSKENINTVRLGSNPGDPAGKLISACEIDLNGLFLKFKSNIQGIQLQGTPMVYGLFFLTTTSVGITSFGETLILCDNGGIGYFMFDPVNHSFQMIDSGIFPASSLVNLLSLNLNDAARRTGLNVTTQTGYDDLMNIAVGRNINNTANARTNYSASNNAGHSIRMGIGSVANTTYPDLGYLETVTAAALMIMAGGATGSVRFGVNANELMRLLANGNFGIGLTIPTAKLHIVAGTATAGSAPFKYTAGVNLTTPEDGAKEFDGTNEFLTAGGTRYTLAKTLTATANLDFPNTASLTSSDLTITVNGATDGDVVSLGVPIAALNANSCYTAFVSAANTVTVRFNNYSALPIDPAAGTFRVSVLKY